MASSILGTRSMGSPFFSEFRKQASSFLKEKIKTARLALTDVTPAQLMTEEVTKGNPCAPDARTMGFISRAAFEVDDYWRIVDILHKRLAKFDPRRWREAYNSLVLLEHLLTHGPVSVAEEFQSDVSVIKDMGGFQYVDEKGYNWGATVQKKSERVLNLLEKGPLWKEERDKARKISRGIQGFGSFNQRWTSSDGDHTDQRLDIYRKSNSHYVHSNDEEVTVSENQNSPIPQTEKSDNVKIGEELVVRTQMVQECGPLLSAEQEIEFPIQVHPFNNLEHQKMESRLLLSQS